MDLEDNGSRARYLIRDRDGRFSGLFDAALADAGIDIILSISAWSPATMSWEARREAQTQYSAGTGFTSIRQVDLPRLDADDEGIPVAGGERHLRIRTAGVAQAYRTVHTGHFDAVVLLVAALAAPPHRRAAIDHDERASLSSAA